MNTKIWLNILNATLLLLVITASVRADDEPSEKSPLDEIKWQIGPTMAKLGSVAEVGVPEGFRFAAADEARKLLEMMENPTDGSELGLLGPMDLEWFVTFEFADVGYVKDDEKDDLDAGAMLTAIRTSTEQSNKLRKQRGWPAMNIVGWQQPPHYDASSNNLEWAILGESQGQKIVNYNTRRLGRSGVMSVALVVDPALLDDTIPKFNDIMGQFQFLMGQGYAEFKSGDKIAEYGLTALVTGGAAAVAVKSGALKWLWKLIVVGVVAVGAFFKRIFGGKTAT